jgi:hypothetical protein
MVMPVLNERNEFQDFVAQFRGLNRCFSGPPRKIRLNPGAQLSRFITSYSKSELAGKKLDEVGVFGSPWWMTRLELRRLLAQYPAVAPQEIIRGKLAIATRFNPKLNGWIDIELTLPVYAWVGRAAQQPDEIRQLSYIGGGEQIFLPNLGAKTDNSSRYARIKFWFGLTI